MKIALTGAAGHLGSALLPELFRRGYTVHALVKDSLYLQENEQLKLFRGDLLDQTVIKQLLDGCDRLIHSAAFISVNGDPTGMVHRVNTEGTRLVMQTALAAGIKRAVQVSSIHAYQQSPAGLLLDETRAYVNDDAFAYDRSKREGQQIALSMNEKGMETIVVNPTSIIGPYDHKPSKMGKVIIDLCTGRLPFVFNGGFDFCDNRDVAAAVANALHMGEPGAGYLLAGKWCHFKELAACLSKAAGKKISPLAFPSALGYMGLPFIKAWAAIKKQEPLYTIEALVAITGGNKKISSARAAKDLAYTTRPFEETVRDAYQWYLQNGYLV